MATRLEGGGQDPSLPRQTSGREKPRCGQILFAGPVCCRLRIVLLPVQTRSRGPWAKIAEVSSARGWLTPSNWQWWNLGLFLRHAQSQGHQCRLVVAKLDYLRIH